jgi:primosomal protein N' (replication factor Y)
MTPTRSRVIEAAAGGLVHGKRELAKLASVGVGVIDGLVDEGTLETVALAPEPVALLPIPTMSAPSSRPASGPPPTPFSPPSQRPGPRSARAGPRRP